MGGMGGYVDVRIFFSLLVPLLENYIFHVRVPILCVYIHSHVLYYSVVVSCSMCVG